MTDDEFPEAGVEYVQEHLDRHGFLSWLDTRVDGMGEGWIEMTVPFDEKLTNVESGNGDSAGATRINGGIAATLIDTAGGIALRPALDDPIEGGVATINLDVNYLRPAVGDLTAEAEVVRVGSTVGVSTVTVESETPDGAVEPIATGQGAYRLFQS